MSRASVGQGSGSRRGPLSYDQAPYPSLSYSQTHPDRLATVATMLGMNPAPVERCRVLELGCAVGGNLIPMAETLPDSWFLGIDLSERQIAEGQSVIESLGLRNISMVQMDILDVDAGLGQFDYIVAHGVYSWVPPAVQDKVLEICKTNLAAHGVGYVSYNTYPGWHMIQIVRDLMLYHTRGVTDPEERASRARSFLGFLAEASPGDNSAYASFLQMYAGILDDKLEKEHRRGASLLLHDELETVNEPTYFHQFAQRAESHGLQYLAEAQFSSMMGGNLQPQVRTSLEELANSLVELEQYLDFLRNRTFRQTLLCHDDVSVTRALTADPIMGLGAASRAQPVAQTPDIHSREIEQFRGQDGALLSTDHPVSKSALLCLGDVWPQVVPFDELLARARNRLYAGKCALADGGQLDSPHDGASPSTQVPGNGDSGENDAFVLAANLLRAYGYSDSLAELHSYSPPIALRVAGRPVATRVARLQARQGDRVTNLRHERVSMDGFDRFLLMHLDGSHDHGALVDLLMAGPVAEGVLTLKAEATTPEDDSGEGADLRAVLGHEVRRRLAGLARAGLLVAS